jgi:hypothetical protein
LILKLFYEAFPIAKVISVELCGKMIISEERVQILMEAIMAYLKWPSQQWPEDTEECHETPIMIDDNQAEIQTCYL